MDDLNNYVSIAGGVNETNREDIQKIKDLSTQMKEKIKQFTDPIGEGFMMEGGKGVLAKGVDNFLGGLTNKGIDVGEAKQITGAYRKGGLKGVIKHYYKKYFKKSENNPVGEGEKVKDAENINDLSPDAFEKAQGAIKVSLKNRFENNFGDNQQKRIVRKYQNERVKESEEPHLPTRQQTNAQKFNDIMDDEEQRGAITEQNLNTTIRNPVIEEGDDLFGNVAQKSISGTIKKNIVGDLNKSLERNVEEQAGKSLEGNILKKAGEKAGARMATEDAEEGGPENLAGDFVSTLVGAGTFLAGVFSSRHIKAQLPHENIANVSYQSGV